MQELDNDIRTQHDPIMFSQAMQCGESYLWSDAVKDEMNSITYIGAEILLNYLMELRPLGVNGSIK